MFTLVCEVMFLEIASFNYKNNGLSQLETVSHQIGNHGTAACPSISLFLTRFAPRDKCQSTALASDFKSVPSKFQGANILHGVE